MELLLALIIFILFWWAILATIFSFQLHKENEDYAKRLGRSRNPQKISHTTYVIDLSNSFLPVNLRSLKFYFTNLSLNRIWRSIPLKINLK
jgi:hypothetical protein